MHVLLNRLTAKPGQRALVVDNLLESGTLFDGNPACLMYLVAEASEDADDIWVIDVWTSEEEHAEALRDPVLQPYISRTTPLLEGMPEQTHVEPRGGKGPAT